MTTLTSKSWRNSPRIKNAQVQQLVMAPFAVVAYINKGNFIHVGVARCNPSDKFDEQSGGLIAETRARLQYAARLGLVPARRIRALARKATLNKSTSMITLTKLQFREMFNTNP